MLTDQQKQQITDKLSSLLAIANARFKTAILMPEVFYDCNNTSGGYHKDGTLHFNPVLTVQNFEDYLNTTVPHEMAHYIQWHVYRGSLTRQITYGRGYRAVLTRRKVHGREWQSIMRLFGIHNPKRCHNYDVTDVKKKRNIKKFPVYCSCQVHQVTARFIVKLTMGKKYKCLVCRSPVSLTNPAAPEIDKIIPLTSPATVVS